MSPGPGRQTNPRVLSIVTRRHGTNTAFLDWYFCHGVAGTVSRNWATWPGLDSSPRVLQSFPQKHTHCGCCVSRYHRTVLENTQWGECEGTGVPDCAKMGQRSQASPSVTGTVRRTLIFQLRIWSLHPYIACLRSKQVVV